MNFFAIEHAPKPNHVLLFVFDFLSAYGVLRYVFILFHGLFETPYSLADRVSQFRKLTGTKNNQNDNQDHQKMHWLEKSSHFLPPLIVY